jgi:hypothetical protein
MTDSAARAAISTRTLLVVKAGGSIPAATSDIADRP